MARLRALHVMARVSLVALVCSGLAIPERADAACNPGRIHDSAARYVITAGSPASLSGVSASIKEYDPFYTGQNGTGTNASVMLAKFSPTQWAQVGWAKSKIQDGVTIKRQVFTEFWIDSSHNFFHFWPAHSVTSTNNYKILYNTSTGVYSYYDNQILLRTDSGIPTPTQYQIFGETHDRADQMPGGTGAHVSLSSATYYTNSSHLAHIVDGAINPDPLFGGAHPSLGRYEIWDKACV